MHNYNEIKKHIVNKILSSVLLNHPYDHKFVEGVFPDLFYNDLLTNIPDKSIFVPINTTGSVTANYSPERFIFNFQEKNIINKLEPSKKAFLQNLFKILTSQDLFTSVTSQFSKTIDARLKNLSDDEKKKCGFPNLEFKIKTALIKDFTKYSLGAHTDTATKFVTFLFYLPSNKDLQKVGTTLYKPIDNPDRDTHNSAEKTKQNFIKIKTCPFIPNSVLIFPRTSMSFHGVEEVNIDQKERNLLSLNYFFKT
ncbi:hypothetical protein OAJ74_02450 [Alphaproteobacteria bacterium]|nr:hypothetical protein [Alphaproteobacteria bacterium]